MEKINSILKEIEEKIHKPFVTPKFGDNWKAHAKKNINKDTLIDIAWYNGRKAILLEEALKECEEIIEVLKKQSEEQISNLSNDFCKLNNDYCKCVQRSITIPISDTEFECFDCGKEVKQIPNPPEPPLGRVIREGCTVFCPKCHSTMSIIKWSSFNRKLFCHNDKCENSYNNYINNYLKNI